MFLTFLISLVYLTRRGALTLLPQPVNVTVESVNLQSEVKWSSVTGTEDVEYAVQYRVNRESFHGRDKGSSSDFSDWLEIPECSPTRSRRCNLTSAIDVFINATLRVRKQDGEQVSLWSLSRPFKAIDQSLLGPPQVSLWSNPETGRLDVRVRDPFHKDYFSSDLKRRLYYKKEKDRDWTVHDDILSSTSINNLVAGSNYCVQARYVWHGKLRPNSVPSPPKCAVIPESENSRTVRITWITALTVPLIFGLSLTCIFLVYRNFDRLKLALRPPLQMPAHLHEFLSGEHPFLPPPLSDSSRSEEEEPYDKISLVTVQDQGGDRGEIDLDT